MARNLRNGEIVSIIGPAMGLSRIPSTFEKNNKGVLISVSFRNIFPIYSVCSLKDTFIWTFERSSIQPLPRKRSASGRLCPAKVVKL